MGAVSGGFSEIRADDGGQVTQIEVISTNYSVAGGQRRFDWKVWSSGGQQEFLPDAVTNFTIQANLEELGMYGFTNNFGTAWSHGTNGDKSFWIADQPGNFPIYPGDFNIFSAFIDETKFSLIMPVDSWGYSRRGITIVDPAEVPVMSFPHEIDFDPSEQRISWFSQTNDLGKRFVVEQTDALTNATWVSVATNLHSTTNFEYTASVPMTNSAGFYRVREVD